jgi:hypothetical protein
MYMIRIIRNVNTTPIPMSIKVSPSIMSDN